MLVGPVDADALGRVREYLMALPAKDSFFRIRFYLKGFFFRRPFGFFVTRFI